MVWSALSSLPRLNTVVWTTGRQLACKKLYQLLTKFPFWNNYMKRIREYWHQLTIVIFNTQLILLAFLARDVNKQVQKFELLIKMYNKTFKFGFVFDI